MKVKRYCFPHSLYKFVKVLTAEEAQALNVEYARATAEDDDPDFNVEEWLFVDHHGYKLSFSPEWVEKRLVEVEVEVPDPADTYVI